MTARARTEMLTRRTRPDGEQRVTTRPAARPPDKIRKILCWALALALWGGSSWSVGVSADFAHAAALGPACWPDNAGSHASAASAGLLAGNLHCNNVFADGKDGTTAHSLSEDSVGSETAKALERPSTATDTEVGPREVALPKVKPRRKVPTLLRGVLIRRQLPSV